jgi:hypothetical protein
MEAAAVAYLPFCSYRLHQFGDSLAMRESSRTIGAHLGRKWFAASFFIEPCLDCPFRPFKRLTIAGLGAKFAAIGKCDMDDHCWLRVTYAGLEIRNTPHRSKSSMKGQLEAREVYSNLRAKQFVRCNPKLDGKSFRANRPAK